MKLNAWTSTTATLIISMKYVMPLVKISLTTVLAQSPSQISAILGAPTCILLIAIKGGSVQIVAMVAAQKISQDFTAKVYTNQYKKD